MVYQKITDFEQIGEVQAYLAEKDFSRIIEDLSRRTGYRSVVWGGSVFVPYFRRICGEDYISEDLDLIIWDESQPLDQGALRAELENDGIKTQLNSFGTLRVKYDATPVDITPLSIEARKVIQPSGFKVDLQGLVGSCELTVGAMAFEYPSGAIHSHGAIESLEGRFVELNNPFETPLGQIVVRGLHKCLRLGFTLGPKLLALNQKIFLDPEHQKVMENYLEYKGWDPQYLDLLRLLATRSEKDLIRSAEMMERHAT
jgi:hypothetical protein